VSSSSPINFWQPSGGRQFRVLQPGEPFLFKLHSPRNLYCWWWILLAISQSSPLALLGVRSQPRTAHKLKEKCEQGLHAIEGFNPVRLTIMRLAAYFFRLRSFSQKTSGFLPQIGPPTSCKGVATIPRTGQACGYGNRSKTA